MRGQYLGLCGYVNRVHPSCRCEERMIGGAVKCSPSDKVKSHQSARKAYRCCANSSWTDGGNNRVSGPNALNGDGSARSIHWCRSREAAQANEITARFAWNENQPLVDFRRVSVLLAVLIVDDRMKVLKRTPRKTRPSPLGAIEQAFDAAPDAALCIFDRR